MTFQNILSVFDTYSYLTLFICFILGAITLYSFVYFFFRKEIRLFKNLKRKIYLLRTGAGDLQTERELFLANGLFDVYTNVIDLKEGVKLLQTLKSYSVFVIGYSKGYPFYKEILDHSVPKKIPVIVIAKPGEIIPEHMTIFQKYVYFEMCNTSARLLTTVFNLSLITPYKKR